MALINRNTASKVSEFGVTSTKERIFDTIEHKNESENNEIQNEPEKTRKVREVFDTMAGKYDLVSDIISLGLHRVWKNELIKRLAPEHGARLLDACGGTGDITFRYIRYLQSLGPAPPGKRSSVTLCDINQAMLDVGKDRAQRLGYTAPSCGVDITWSCGDVENLSAPDGFYTGYTIAFGVRNCTHPDKLLREAYRVLAPGGRFLCLEFTKMANATVQWMFDWYMFRVIPAVGRLIVGEKEPFIFLAESIRDFPDQETFKTMIEQAGFSKVTYDNMAFGLCGIAIHSGYKI